MIKNPLRLAAGLVLALAAVPTTWAHRADDPVKPSFGAREIPIDQLPPEIARDLGPFTLTQAWELESDSHRNHSYSALALGGDGRLFLASDKGDLLIRSRPFSVGQTAEASFASLNDGDPDSPDWNRDVEAIVLDEESDSLWLSVENFQSIRKLNSAGQPKGWLRPRLMRDWSSSSGAEVMVRLEDGRFVVIREGRENGSHRGLLFPDDPTLGAEPTAFTLEMPGKFLPTEMAILPDGSALVLGRDFQLPFKFETMIAHVDLKAVLEDGTGRARELARITDSALSDNYEGMVIEPDNIASDLEDGMIRLWIVSDNNLMQALQRTLLLQLEVRLTDITRGARF